MLRNSHCQRLFLQLEAADKGRKAQNIFIVLQNLSKTVDATSNDLLSQPSSDERDTSTFQFFMDNIRKKHFAASNPWKFWCSQPESALKKFALETFAHHVSNVSLEGFFSICKSIAECHANSITNEELETLSLLSSNKDIVEEKIIEPIKMKYNY